MKERKKMTLKKFLLISVPCLVLAIALIIGNVFANIYENLITIFFSKSNYSVTDEEKEVCEQVVAEGAVLLKNDGGLPLKSNEKKVALLGQDSVDFVYGGAGSGAVDTSSAPNLKTAFEKSGFTVNKTVWDFYTTGEGKSYRKKTPDEGGHGTFEVNEVPRSKLNGIASSLTDDFAVVCIGRSGGESADLPVSPLSTGSNYLQVDDNECDTIKLACEKYEKVILIVNCNNPVELGFLETAEYAKVKAVLWIGGVGQEGMYAIPKILKGEVNPSGRLTDTYAYDATSAPATVNMGSFGYNTGVDNGNKYIVYQEGIYIGYRYYETRYEDVVLGAANVGAYNYATTVQYPFGYGLSYSNFVWSDYTVDYDSEKDEFTVSVKVTNNGNEAGKDVVEIYAGAPYTEYDKANGIEKSAVVLVGFAKTEKLDAKGGDNDSQTVTVKFDKRQLASYDYNNKKTYILDDGNYYIAAGKNAHDALNNILSKKNEGGVSVDVSKMTDAGDATLVDVYNQSAFDDTTYSKSVTGTTITNQFDDVKIENYVSNCTYVSRKDWTGTIPTNGYAWGEVTQKLKDDLEFYRGEGVTSGVSDMPTFNSTSTSYKVNDLVETDFTDAKWTALIQQLKISQATKLVRLGGYSTIQIDKIGLPMTQDKDGPSGISGTLVGGTSCMAWPVETVMASTWNAELMEKMGTLIGEDSISAGVAGWYAPGVNIHRSPFSGRNFEYYSEDGLLSGKIGAAEMRGVRSRGVIAYMKHFALNDQETNRYGGCIYANEQEIREICLKGFEYVVVEGKANAAMAAMNRVGTRWVGAHKGLMTNILRDEWGFNGMVITDQASVPAMFYQDMLSGLYAGTDLWLNTNANFWSLTDYENNATVMTNVQKAAKNIVYSITNSNAVQTYSDAGTTEVKNNIGDGVPTWKILLIVADVIIFIGCAIGIGLSLFFYLKDNILKKKQSFAVINDDDNGGDSQTGTTDTTD